MLTMAQVPVEEASWFVPYHLQPLFWKDFLNLVTFTFPNRPESIRVDLRSHESEPYYQDFLSTLVERLVRENVQVNEFYAGYFESDDGSSAFPEILNFLARPCFRSMRMLDLGDVGLISIDRSTYPNFRANSDDVKKAETILKSLKVTSPDLSDIRLPSLFKKSLLHTALLDGYEQLYVVAIEAGFRFLFFRADFSSTGNLRTEFLHLISLGMQFNVPDLSESEFALVSDMFTRPDSQSTQSSNDTDVAAASHDAHNCLPTSTSSVEHFRYTKSINEDPVWAAQRSYWQHDTWSSLGDNVVVAVLDSGVDGLHVALRNQIVFAKSFVPHQHALIDTDGHGTMCAGLIGSSTVGVAPKSKLAIFKVSNGTSFLEALRAMVSMKSAKTLDVDIISISIGWKLNEVSGEFCIQVEWLLDELRKLNVVIFCAGSNYGLSARTTIAFPASSQHVICVGSHTNGFRESDFSPDGDNLFILGPGERICCLVPRPCIRSALLLHSELDKGHYAFCDGTSFATPQIAGFAALLVSYLKCTPGPAPNRLFLDLFKYLFKFAGRNSDEWKSREGYGPLMVHTLTPTVNLQNSHREIHISLN